MNNLYRLIVLLLALASASISSASAPSSSSSPPTLIMGYKEGSKPPYIGPKGDNTGAYQELFSAAADMIGLQLKIKRLPKKRIYKQLEMGEIDFYPSSGFSAKRKSYLYWMPNGFVSKQALLSNIINNEITDFKQTKGVLLSPLGSSVKKYADYNYRISVQKMGELPIDKAVLALRLGRGNFYIYDIDIFDYYLKRKKLKHFEEISLRLHPNAIQKPYTSLHAAFSIHSKHFHALRNPNYQNDKKSGFNNQEFIPAKDSIAAMFENALKKLQSTHKTKAIYNKYFQ